MTATAKKTTTPKSPVDHVEFVAQAQKETVEAAVKAGAEAMTRGYERAVEMTREQVDKASTFAFKGYDDMASFNRENLDAVVETSNIVAKGVEDLGKAVTTFTQSAFETSLATTKKMFAAKNFQEVVDLQNAWAKETLDGFLGESAKLHEMSLKLATSAAVPMNQRVGKAIERMSKPLAA